MTEAAEDPEKFHSIDETIAEIQRVFHVSLSSKTIRTYCARGILRAVRVGNFLRVTDASLREYLRAPSRPSAKAKPSGPPARTAPQPPALAAGKPKARRRPRGWIPV